MTRHAMLAIGLFVAMGGCGNQDKAAPAASEAAAFPAGPPRMNGDPAKNPDMTGLAKEVDADGNGQLSRAEWRGKGLPESSFNMFEKGRGFVTLEDYQKNAAPPGIDLDGDGKLTVAEFKEFDKKMAPQMNGQGAPPPPKP